MQYELDQFRKDLNLDPWDIGESETLFLDSLREYARINHRQFHLDIEYKHDKLILYLSFSNQSITVEESLERKSYSTVIIQLKEMAAKKISVGAKN